MNVCTVYTQTQGMLNKNRKQLRIFAELFFVAQIYHLSLLIKDSSYATIIKNLRLVIDMVKAVIFDMDGLLLDSERASYKAMKNNCQKLGVEIDKAFYCSLLGLSNIDAKREVYKYFDGKVDVERYFDDMFEIVKEDYIKDGVPVKDGAFELLKYLRKNNIAAVVASSSDREWVEWLLKRAGLYEYFDGFMCGDEVKNAKPNPEIFLKACQKVNAQPENALVLEDAQSGIEAANAAGIPVICVRDMLDPDEKHKEMTLSVMDSLNEVKEYLERV